MVTVEHDSWLLVAVTTAGAPASLRVTVWRRLKALGALYLQQSVCLLPTCAPTLAAVESLRQRVCGDGGSIRTLSISVTDPVQQEQLVAGLREARDDEYGEVLDRLPDFFTELNTETASGRTTYEELEESEADLARFQSWMAKIAARDYFAAPRGQQAREELARAEAALAAFAELAMAAADSDDVAPRLRSIN